MPSSGNDAVAHEESAVHALRESADTPQLTEATVAQFHERYRDESMPELVLVIPALNEEPSIGGVLDEIPDVIGGLSARALVVDDGSSDRTGEVSAEHGALVARLAHNCGQGTASRVGYRLAREGGARYIATLDADGQWNPADLPPMIELLEADKADLVLGSRQLGHTENSDAVRNLGVRVFSRMISLLTRTKVTDSSSGLRAMRVEVPAHVRQTQPQYQAAEFLIGAIFQGYRVAEVPTVMRVRSAGESKKGRNSMYGVKYSQVIFRTVWREWRTRIR